MRIFAVMIVALLLDACAALPQGPGLDAMAVINRLFDSGSRSSTTYRAGVQPTQLAQSDPIIAATRVNEEQSLAPVEARASAPRLDVEGSCRKAEALGVGQTTDDCLSSENEARAQLVGRWIEFSSADRSLCTRSSIAGGGGTYTELLTCLELATIAKTLTSPKPRP
jgi:hypothetical protein